MHPAGAIVGLGELLWDLLPGGQQLGGAPANFAFHCRQLGHPAAVVSRVGADELGRAARERLRALGLSDDYVQADDAHPTGTVGVALDESGHPTYTIHADVAWEHLAWDERLLALLGRAEAVCFGTLAQRHPTSRETIHQALRAAPNALTIYDVNLRQDHYGRDTVEASLRACRWVKLNDDELVVLRDLLGLEGTSEGHTLSDLRRRYGVELAALTRGGRGCLVQTDDEEVSAAAAPVTVVDAVGAGDAFTAGLLCAVLEGRAVGEAAAFANRLAARVVASAGGTPAVDRAELDG